MIRIEHDHPLAILTELPDAWAQSIITGPPVDLLATDRKELSGLLAVIGQAHRVTRQDGTLLWSTDRPLGMPLRQLACSFAMLGWSLRRSPLASATGHLLFVKEPLAYWRPQIPSSRRCESARRPASCPSACRRPGGVWWSRRPWCVPAGPAWPPRAQRRVEWLLLAASAPRACGACGTPWRSHGSAPRDGQHVWRPACAHHNPTGRCLVIDPYHQPAGPLALAAVRHGRSFLGIQAPEVRSR